MHSHLLLDAKHHAPAIAAAGCASTALMTRVQPSDLSAAEASVKACSDFAESIQNQLVI
jgi:hypothetical protein